MDSEFGGGGGSRDIKDLEKKQKLPKDLEKAVDAVFFDGSNSDGWYFTLGTAERIENVLNLFMILRIPNVGTFIAPEMLKSTNVPSEGKSNTWAGAGWEVSCVEPMKKWLISFEGFITPSPGSQLFTQVGEEQPDPNAKLVPAKINLEWTNYGEHFDFDLDISPTAIAHSMAIEPWSRELFDKAKKSHQTHYEQFGFLNGTYIVDGTSYGPIRLTSMRDHTVAKFRRWSDIRRYIMMIYHLEDGTCIHTSVISMPETVFTHLEFGYIITADKKKYAVDRVHFQLPHHGEDKNFPSKFHYSFDAAHLHYDVEVEIIDTASFKMGLDLACQVNENMALFNANGLKGYGFAEVEYRISPY
ncbi:unnamed protein product [Auanema sp. JU1783]|nr:unnamed protein product [Auanema sp. JU1783]